MNVREPGVTEAQYIEVIEAKTARLFQAATELGAVLAADTAERQAALASFGMHLGTAFQIADDVLDYQSDSATMGKNIGDDLAEGKTTLPLIYAMRDGTQSQAERVATAIREGGLEHLDDVLDIIEKTDALANSIRRAVESSDSAIASLAALPESDCRNALEQISRYSVERTF